MGKTWLVLADGRRARVYEESSRGGELAELAPLAMRIEEGDLYDPQDRPPRSFSSVGSHRSAMDRGVNLHEREEENFLKRLAASLAEKESGYDELVLMAPPRALGLLRTLLRDRVAAKIAHEAPLNVIDESAAVLRQRLRDLRIP